MLQLIEQNRVDRSGSLAELPLLLAQQVVQSNALKPAIMIGTAGARGDLVKTLGDFGLIPNSW